MFDRIVIGRYEPRIDSLRVCLVLFFFCERCRGEERSYCSIYILYGVYEYVYERYRR